MAATHRLAIISILIFHHHKSQLYIRTTAKNGRAQVGGYEGGRGVKMSVP
jgi:hypothetical protein